MDDYQDPRIRCTPTAVVVRGYYFPWGSKTIPYAAIKGIRRFTMTPLHGQGRIWGSGNLSIWANFDPGRPKKKVGLLVDLGKRVEPLLTPDDPDAFVATLARHTGITPTELD